MLYIKKSENIWFHFKFMNIFWQNILFLSLEKMHPWCYHHEMKSQQSWHLPWLQNDSINKWPQKWIPWLTPVIEWTRHWFERSIVGNCDAELWSPEQWFIKLAFLFFTRSTIARVRMKYELRTLVSYFRAQGVNCQTNVRPCYSNANPCLWAEYLNNIKYIDCWWDKSFAWRISQYKVVVFEGSWKLAMWFSGMWHNTQNYCKGPSNFGPRVGGTQCLIISNQ